MKIVNVIRKNILTILFLAFICLTMFDYCAGIVPDARKKVSYEKTEYTEEFIELQKKQMTTANTDEKQLGAGENKYINLYRKATNFASNYNNLAIKNFLLNLNARICKSAGMSYIAGTTFLKLDDGMLVSLNQDGNFEEERLEVQAEYLRNFTQKLKEKGINYAYIDCPNKERLFNDRLPFGFQDSAKHDENKYMHKVFSEKNIPLLDLSGKMIKNDEDLFNMFYKTDHHWKAEYGIEAAKYISEYLNSEYDYKIDSCVFDESNYSVKKYKKCLLGSTGINSTNSFVEAEDFLVFLPKEKAKFSFEIPSKNVDLDGDFSIFLNYEKLDKKESWPFNAYASYIYANSAYIKIENQSIDDNHKVLIIKDSFANAIVPYLAQVVGRVDVVDIRKGQTDHFNGSLTSLIDENDYDTVLFIYNNFSYEFDRLYLR